MLKTRDIVTDVRTNSLVMRDTPDAIAVAEKLIAANDVADPEVMLEVEVMEVSADRLTNLGPEVSGVLQPGHARPTAATLGALRGLTGNDLSASGLSLGLNLLLQDTDTNILASPRIRVRHKEKARILVGDKVPVITNLISPQQNGANSVITGSIQYVDVGIKLEVEPQVYTDGDVGIKINLEVSNISKTITTQSGVAYQIGTRNATTSLRLRDGETQVHGRPDQRPGPQHRQQAARPGPAARARPAVHQHQRQRQQERDRAVDHAAHRARPGHARGPLRRGLERHRTAGARTPAAHRPRW